VICTIIITAKMRAAADMIIIMSMRTAAADTITIMSMRNAAADMSIIMNTSISIPMAAAAVMTMATCIRMTGKRL